MKERTEKSSVGNDFYEGIFGKLCEVAKDNCVEFLPREIATGEPIFDPSFDSEKSNSHLVSQFMADKAGQLEPDGIIDTADTDSNVSTNKHFRRIKRGISKLVGKAVDRIVVCDISRP